MRFGEGNSCFFGEAPGDGKKVPAFAAVQDLFVDQPRR